MKKDKEETGSKNIQWMRLLLTNEEVEKVKKKGRTVVFRSVKPECFYFVRSKFFNVYPDPLP